MSGVPALVKREDGLHVKTQIIFPFYCRACRPDARIGFLQSRLPDARLIARDFQPEEAVQQVGLNLFLVSCSF